MDLLRITRSPNNLLFALFISIIAHFALLYILGFLPFSHESLQVESILVDFTLMDGEQGSGVRGQGSGGERRSGEAAKRRSGEGKEESKEKKSNSRNTANEGNENNNPDNRASSMHYAAGNVTEAKEKSNPIMTDIISLNPAPGQRGRGGEADGSLQKGGGAGSGGAGYGGGGGTDKGSGSSGGEEGNRPHDYGYVREIVMKHLKYPEKARRMGLEGRVIMSFIITEAGLARDIKVVESSGFQMLDDAASDAISRVNLSRSNPHRLIVHLPVEFRLR